MGRKAFLAFDTLRNRWNFKARKAVQTSCKLGKVSMGCKLLADKHNNGTIFFNYKSCKQGEGEEEGASDLQTGKWAEEGLLQFFGHFTCTTTTQIMQPTDAHHLQHRHKSIAELIFNSPLLQRVVSYWRHVHLRLLNTRKILHSTRSDPELATTAQIFTCSATASCAIW